MHSNTATIAATALALLLSLTALPPANAAAPASAESGKPAADEDVAEVVVTGSLIPQVRLEGPTPVTVISGADIEARGFANVAEALQRSSFATGSVQGPQFNGGFTPGAQTLSLFGLSPSYVKYLIDGRPIADYPALYNGTDIIPSLNGIPTVLVDHIDVLPGGQSSIYGSDAIAGVVNIVMKKKVDGPVLDARYGFTKDGGGTDRRLAAADTLSFGGIDLTVGGQYEKTDPIYGFQRDLTRSYFNQGTTPQVAGRDFLLFGLFGDPGTGNTYYFEDPANCANVSKLFGNSAAKQFRARRGNYCGTTNTGYYTIGNGLESTQGWLHAADDLNEHVQVFTDLLVSHEVTRFNTGGGFFGTSNDTKGPYNYYLDPNIGDLLNVQRVFAPEEFGDMKSVMSKTTNNMVRGTLGVKGLLAGSWTYSADVTYTENKLTERTHMLFTSSINNFFSSIFGPNLGVDPTYGANTFTPNYPALYQPITPAQYKSFSGWVNSYSRTEDSLFRGQLTSTSLFSLPGGDAGLAAVVEGGRQGWDYAPDPRFATGETYLYTSTAGSGHRTRYAGTVEIRLPVLKTLTASASGRYDAYKIAEGTVDKATYNLGLEYRPLKAVLLRGRYGTAFKAPTLSDQFQGSSGFFETLTDYYTCAVNGYTGPTLGNCPQAQQSYFGTTSGNPKLKPITAKVWDVGFVLTPLERLSISADYIRWDIDNEVIAQNATALLVTESQCRLGQLDIKSPTCVAALSQVSRDNNGVLLAVSTPKINQSKEKLNVLTIGAGYGVNAGAVGDFEFTVSYSDDLKHQVQRYANDPLEDVFNDPINFTDFKSKENASVTWTLADFSSTFYVERYGRSPNYLSTINGFGTAGAARLPTWTLCNLSLSYRKWSSLEVTAAVNNLFNKMPPIDHSYPGIEQQPYNVLNYNIFGRTVYLEASYKFHK